MTLLLKGKGLAGEHRHLLRFGAVGAFNTAVDFAVFGLLVGLAGLSPYYANLLAFAAAVLCSFVLNRNWSFRDRLDPSSVPSNGVMQLASFVLFMSATALFCSWLLTQLIAAGVGLVPAKIGVTAVSMLINYAVMSRLIFNNRNPISVLSKGAVLCAATLCMQVFLPARSAPLRLDPELAALYDTPVSPPASGQRVFHLGHSLVGRDMPSMLAQLADGGHRYELQLGWGTPLRDHWDPEREINGFAHENATPRYRDARTALASGEYDAFVMTEMIGLEAAIRYFESRRYAVKWAEAAFAGRSDIKVYLYETWHPLDDPGDWLNRFSDDLQRLWEAELLWPAVDGTKRPIYLIPAGQVMARLVREAESTPGGIGGLRDRKDLFARSADGKQDTIHLNDLGLYLVALTHYATIYGKSPVGLPHELLRADNTPADAPSPELARRMQEIVWEVVTGLQRTGVQGAQP